MAKHRENHFKTVTRGWAKGTVPPYTRWKMSRPEAMEGMSDRDVERISLTDPQPVFKAEMQVHIACSQPEEWGEYHKELNRGFDV